LPEKERKKGVCLSAGSEAWGETGNPAVVAPRGEGEEGERG